MLDQNTCSFLLVMILILMLVHYSVKNVEDFNVSKYNTSTEKLNQILHPAFWTNEDKIFYVAVGPTPGSPEMFLSASRNTTGIKKLKASATFADKIHFVQDQFNPNRWHIQVFDEATKSLYQLIDSASDPRNKKFGSNKVIETFTTEQQYDINATENPSLVSLDYTPQQGSMPEDTAVRKWQGLTPGFVSMMDKGDRKTSVLGEHRIIPSSKLPVELDLATQGEPAVFNMHNVPDGTLEIYFQDPRSNIIYPVVVNETGRVYVDYENAGAAVGATKLRLFKGTNVTGVIKNAAFWNDKLVMELFPAPEVGTTVEIGDDLVTIEEPMPEKVNPAYSNLLDASGGTIKKEVLSNKLPYKFHIVCPKEFIEAYIKSHGGSFGGGTGSLGGLLNPIMEKDLGKMLTASGVAGLRKSYRATNIGTLGFGNTSFIQPGGHRYQLYRMTERFVGNNGRLSIKERFVEANKMGSSGATDPKIHIPRIGEICRKSHIYVVEVLTKEGNIINKDGTTTRPDGTPGPDAAINFSPADLVNKHWLREDAVL